MQNTPYRLETADKARRGEGQGPTASCRRGAGAGAWARTEQEARGSWGWRWGRREGPDPVPLTGGADLPCVGLVTDLVSSLRLWLHLALLQYCRHHQSVGHGAQQGLAARLPAEPEGPK